MLRLAQTIKPGVEVRIERSRPTWAAGWLEDYAIDDSGDALQHLYEHLREEHGGQAYKLTVLAPGDTPLYVGAVTIAGPVRAQGRVVTRESWDPPGRERTQPAQAAQPAPQAFPMGEMLTAFGGFMQLILGQQDKAAQAQIEAVRQMVTASQQQTADFTTALLTVRSAEGARSGLAGQISELMEGVTAVEGLRKRFGAASGGGSGEDESALDGALKQATQHFLGAVMGSTLARRAAPAPPRRRVAPVRPIAPSQGVGEQPQGIPDAIPGQAAAQN